MVPNWHSRVARVASWDRFSRPKVLSKYGYLGFDGRNLPTQAGTVICSIKADVFGDDKQHCFMVLPRTVTGMVRGSSKRMTAVPLNGFG